MMAPQILMEDDFRHGLDLTDRWAITRFPPRFSADDGIVSASDRGLYVKAAETNSQTGKPAFSEVAYDRAAGTARWLINDTEVARVTKIGLPAPDATTIIDHGGTPEVVSPQQLNCGMAMFTLLDGGLAPSGTGLVSLAPPYRFPTGFAAGPKLFGQGAELYVERFKVQSCTQE